MNSERWSLLRPVRLFTVHHSPFTIHRSPFTTHYSLFTTHRSPFTVHRTPSQARHAQRGQAIIESSLVLALVCLVLFGLFEISQLFAAQEILDYAAARGARAETVGFNRFMVRKIVRVGAIPNAGRMINPVVNGGPAAQSDIEMARIPLYLGGENGGRLTGILDYDHWDSIDAPVTSLDGAGLIHERIGQVYDLKDFPFSKAFYGGDSLPLNGEAYIESHYPLYMNEY